MPALYIVTPFTAHEEGGYSIDRRDKGCWTGNKVGSGRLIGCTYGVSAAVLIDYESPDNPDAVTALRMRGLTLDTFEAIFASRYYNVMRAGDFPASVAIVASDFAYNAGVAAAARCVQRVVDAKPDGWIGDKTLAAAAGYDASRLGALAHDTARALQRFLGVTIDGDFGPASRSALLAHPHGRDLALIAAITDLEAAHYRSLTDLFAIYGDGWIGRTERRLALALKGGFA